MTFRRVPVGALVCHVAVVSGSRKAELILGCTLIGQIHLDSPENNYP